MWWVAPGASGRIGPRRRLPRGAAPASPARAARHAAATPRAAPRPRTRWVAGLRGAALTDTQRDGPALRLSKPPSPNRRGWVQRYFVYWLSALTGQSPQVGRCSQASDMAPDPTRPNSTRRRCPGRRPPQDLLHTIEQLSKRNQELELKVHKLSQALAPHGSPSIKRQSSLNEGEHDALKGGEDDVDLKLRAVIQKLQRLERVSGPAARLHRGAGRGSARLSCAPLGAWPAPSPRTKRPHLPASSCPAGQRQAGARVLQPAAPAARLARV
jgi:hypothetical protein